MRACTGAAFPLKSATAGGSSARVSKSGTQFPASPNGPTWTGDPFYDCYAHAEPGTQGLYSSAGFWRLGQALTYVWGRDLKGRDPRSACSTPLASRTSAGIGSLAAK